MPEKMHCPVCRAPVLHTIQALNQRIVSYLSWDASHNDYWEETDTDVDDLPARKEDCRIYCADCGYQLKGRMSIVDRIRQFIRRRKGS